MNTDKNSKSSVDVDDESISVNGISINDELMNLRLTTRNISENVRAISDKLAKLLDLGKAIDRVGGSLPYNLRAALGGLDPLDREMSDEDFVTAILEIEKANKNPIQAALSFGSLAKKILCEISKCNHRIEKLAERIRSEHSGAEREVAKRMKSTTLQAVDVFNRRLEIALSKFFVARNRSVDGITRVTEAVYNLFPNGSPILRRAYLANSSSALHTFKSMDDRFFLGETNPNRKTVKI